MHDAHTPPPSPQGPTRPEDVARQIEQAVTEAVQTRVQAAQAAADARAVSQAQAELQLAQAQGGPPPPPPPPPPPEPGAVFRVGPGGRLIEVSPGEAGEPGEAAEQVTVAVQEAPPFPFESQFPHEIMVIAIAFFAMIAIIIVGLPIARAIGRRMDRGAAAPARPSPEQAEQLRHIQTAVDAMAVEIERISENQRFVTRLLAEGGAPAVARLEQGARAGAPIDAPGDRR